MLQLLINLKVNIKKALPLPQAAPSQTALVSCVAPQGCFRLAGSASNFALADSGCALVAQALPCSVSVSAADPLTEHQALPSQHSRLIAVPQGCCRSAGSASGFAIADSGCAIKACALPLLGLRSASGFAHQVGHNGQVLETRRRRRRRVEF